MKRLLLYIFVFLSLAPVAQAQTPYYWMAAGNSATATTYCTWSPTNKSSFITLSNGNLTALGSSGQPGTGVGTIGKSSGKWYWEVTVDAKSNTSTMMGIANFLPTSTNAQPIGFTTGSWAWRSTPWCVTNNASAFGSCSIAYVVGQIISFALDMDGGTCAFYLNGTLEYTVTGLSGTWYPGNGSDAGSPAGKCTANFGASSFTYKSTIDPTNVYNNGVY